MTSFRQHMTTLIIGMALHDSIRLFAERVFPDGGITIDDAVAVDDAIALAGATISRETERFPSDRTIRNFRMVASGDS